MTRFYWLFGVVFLLGIGFLIPPAAHSLTLAPEASAFSALYKMADVVVVGTVGTRTREGRTSRIPLHVQSLIRGTAARNILTIESSSAFDGASSLAEGSKWLLFLKSEGSVFRMLIGGIGKFSPDQETDIRLITAAYESDSDLFTSSRELQTLFHRVSSERIGQRLLLDIERNLTEEDIDFITELFRSTNPEYQRVGVREIGRLRLVSFREEVEALLQSSRDRSVRFDVLRALGNLGNPESLPVVLEYLSDEIQSTRRAAITAAAQIATNGIVEPLKNLYLIEPDRFVRWEIIDAIQRAPDKALVEETVAYLRGISAD